MATATGTDVVRAAKSAGFPDDQLVTAAAVAYAESGLRTDAVANEPDGSHSYGVWQINSSHGYPELSSGGWANLGTNAQLAYRVWQAQGWNAWSVHKPTDAIGHARYLAAIGPAAAWVTAAVGAAAATAGTVVAGTTGEVSAATGAVSDAVSGTTALLKEPLGVLHWLTQPGSWERILKVVIGGALAVGGAYLLVHLQFLEPVGSKVVGVVGGAVAPEATVAKGAAKKAAAGAAQSGGSGGTTGNPGN